MKLATFVFTSLICHFTYASVESDLQKYLDLAQQKQLDQQTTWQRLMYADQKQNSEVTYAGYFYAKDGKKPPRVVEGGGDLPGLPKEFLR